MSVAIEAPTSSKSAPKPFANGNTTPKLAPNSSIVVLPNLTVVNNKSETSPACSAVAPNEFKAEVKISAETETSVFPAVANLEALANNKA